MASVQISARVDPALKKALEEYCRSRGIVMNHFIQEAILDRLGARGRRGCQEDPPRTDPPAVGGALGAEARWQTMRLRSAEQPRDN